MSRHVVHDETCFPFLSSSHPVSSRIDPIIFFPSSTSLTTFPQRMSVPLSENFTELEGGNDVDSSNLSDGIQESVKAIGDQNGDHNDGSDNLSVDIQESVEVIDG